MMPARCSSGVGSTGVYRASISLNPLEWKRRIGVDSPFERMKWIAVWIGVCIAWVVVFVAVPRPALLWAVSSFDLFGDGMGRAGNRTGSPVEPLNDGGDWVASRRTTGTYQTDSAGRARMIGQPPTPAGESVSRTGDEVCGPATIRLTQPWKPAKEPEYVGSFGVFTPDFEVEPDEEWKQLGEHRTSAILEFGTDVESRCGVNTCRTCVVAVTARIGFAPSEIRLHEDLRRNHCARKLTMQHEQEHAAITRKAQAIAVEEARRNLAWTRLRQVARVSPASGGEAAQQELMRKVEQDLVRALDKAVAYSDKWNAYLDQPERYRRESRRQWRLCRDG